MSRQFETKAYHYMDVQYNTDCREPHTIFEDIMKQIIIQLSNNEYDVRIDFTVQIDEHTINCLNMMFSTLPVEIFRLYPILNEFSFGKHQITSTNMTWQTRRRFTRIPISQSIEVPKQNRTDKTVLAITTYNKDDGVLISKLVQMINRLYWSRKNEKVLNAKIYFIGKISDQIMSSIQQAFNNHKMREQIPAYESYNINIDVNNHQLVLSSFIR
jgi:hypothetical protein